MHLFFTSLVLAFALWATCGTLIRAAHNVKTNIPQDTGPWALVACAMWGILYYQTHS